MPAIGMGIAWLGYSVASWGYLLVRGYDVKFTDWINPLHPYNTSSWPPPKIPASEVIPGQAATSAQTAAKTTGVSKKTS